MGRRAAYSPGQAGSPAQPLVPCGPIRRTAGASITSRARAAHRLYMTVERLLAPLTDAFLFESGFIERRFDAEVGAATRLRRVVVNGLRAADFVEAAANA